MSISITHSIHLPPQNIGTLFGFLVVFPGLVISFNHGNLRVYTPQCHHPKKINNLMKGAMKSPSKCPQKNHFLRPTRPSNVPYAHVAFPCISGGSPHRSIPRSWCDSISSLELNPGDPQLAKGEGWTGWSQKNLKMETPLMLVVRSHPGDPKICCLEAMK